MFRKEFQIYCKAEKMLRLFIDNTREFKFPDTVMLLEAAIRKVHISPALLVN